MTTPRRRWRPGKGSRASSARRRRAGRRAIRCSSRASTRSSATASWHRRLLNVFAGVATCLLVYLIGARVFDRRTGVVAALLLAVLPSHVYRTTLLMTEVLTGAVVALLAYLLLRWVLKEGGPSRLQAVALGVFFGAFALMRGEALAFVPVALILWKLVEPSWRRLAGGAALMLAALGPGHRAVDGAKCDHDARVHTGRQRPRPHVPRRPPERPLRHLQRLPGGEDHGAVLRTCRTRSGR